MRGKESLDNLYVMGDKLLIRPLPPETQIGGIIIPDVGQKVKTMGTVIKHGPGRRTELGEILPCEFSVGDVVIYGAHAGTILEYADEELILLDPEDVLAVEREPVAENFEVCDRPLNGKPSETENDGA